MLDLGCGSGILSIISILLGADEAVAVDIDPNAVDKDDVRIEANGTLDELNAAIGVIRAMAGEGHEWQEMLFRMRKFSQK